MSRFLNKPIAYLVADDFDNQGNITNPDVPTDIPVVIMLQAVFCGHCDVAKPVYQKFADDYRGKVFCSNVQGDGKETEEKTNSEIMNKIDPEFVGYPHYVLYKGGKKVNKKIKGRSYGDLKDFSGM